MAEKRLQFNLSPSSIGLYNQSQLQFYCNYIEKREPDTDTIKIYGQSGTIVHECMEKYFEGASLEQQKKYFEEQWVKKRLDKVRGLNGKPLSKETYWNAVRYGNIVMQRYYDIVSSEELIQFPLVDNEKALINIKGYIDVVCKDKNGNIIILDYKTSSKIGDFRNQALHYAYSYYKKYKKLPRRAVFEYVKIQKRKEYIFEPLEFVKYDKYLKKLANEIIEKGRDVNNYELGDYDNIFNEHLLFCKQVEKNRKENDVITVTIDKGKLLLDDKILTKKYESLKKSIERKYRYKVQGCEWSDKYQSGRWDGYKYLYRRNTLPLGFINDFQKLIKDYNKYYNANIKLQWVDKRDKEITEKQFSNIFKESSFELRLYQREAIEKALNMKFGILSMGTGSGKTITAAEFIRKVNQRTLFIINRNELIRQTAEEFEKILGVEVGVMTAGELVVDKRVTVASVQTLNSILNGGNKSRKSYLIRYLYNVQLLVVDEAQFAADNNFFGIINKYCVNTNYRIGLSGSAWRTQGDTLEMNSLIGFPIYQKSTKELEDEDYLVPTKCFFINNICEAVGGSYHEKYDTIIVHNDNRNNFVCDIIKNNPVKKFLVTTKKVEHAQLLKSYFDNAYLITGSTNKKQRVQWFEDFKNGKGGVLIGTQSIFAVGVDIPSCDCIINVAANKSDSMTVQTIGRVKRKFKNKDYSYYIDFIDNNSVFQKSSRERQQILKDYGNEVEVVNSVQKLL